MAMANMNLMCICDKVMACTSVGVLSRYSDLVKSL